MSTILNALKRAEQDCPTQAKKNRVALRLNPRTNQERLPARFKWPALALCCVVSAGAFFFSTRPHVQPVPWTQKTMPETTAMALPEQKALAMKPEQPAKKPQIVVAAPLVTEKKPLLPKPGKPPLPVPVKPAVQPDTSQSIAEMPPETPDNPGKPDIIPMDNGIFKLQAISWAKNPIDRIAVIDNRVVRQGEAVQGYRILDIRQDQVILGLSGQQYALGFKYR